MLRSTRLNKLVAAAAGLASLLALQAAVPAIAATPKVVINEVHCVGIDAIELYNTTSKSVDISNWIVADKKFTSGKHQFVIPRATHIKAHGYYTLKQGTTTANIPFGIDCERQETVWIGYLSGLSEVTVDSIKLPVILPGANAGRLPNGKGAFDLIKPSLGKANVSARPVLTNKTLICKKQKPCTIALKAGTGTTFDLYQPAAGVTLSPTGSLKISARKAQKLKIQLDLSNAFGNTLKTITVTIK